MHYLVGDTQKNFFSSPSTTHVLHDTVHTGLWKIFEKNVFKFSITTWWYHLCLICRKSRKHLLLFLFVSNDIGRTVLTTHISLLNATLISGTHPLYIFVRGYIFFKIFFLIFFYVLLVCYIWLYVNKCDKYCCYIHF